MTEKKTCMIHANACQTGGNFENAHRKLKSSDQVSSIKFCTSLALGNPNQQLAPCYLAQYRIIHFLIKRSLFAWTPPSCLFCGFFRSRTFTQPVNIATFAVKYSSYRVITSICSPKLSFTGIKTRLCRSAGCQIFDNLTPFCLFLPIFDQNQ